MIHLEVVAEERKAEAAASLERAVAGPAVAAELSEKGDDVPAKGRYFFDVGRRKSPRDGLERLFFGFGFLRNIRGGRLRFTHSRTGGLQCEGGRA